MEEKLLRSEFIMCVAAACEILAGLDTRSGWWRSLSTDGRTCCEALSSPSHPYHALLLKLAQPEDMKKASTIFAIMSLGEHMWESYDQDAWEDIPRSFGKILG